jgi:hypothetical protein
VAVELRTEKDAARLSTSLAQRPSRTSCSSPRTCCASAGLHARRDALVGVGLLPPHARRLDSASELRFNPLDRPLRDAELGTQRPHHPHRGGLLLVRVATRVGFLFASSFGITPSSCPRPGASIKLRALQSDLAKTEVGCGLLDRPAFADERDRTRAELWWVGAWYVGEPFMKAID